MNNVLFLWHSANPNCVINWQPSWDWWSKCSPKSFTLQNFPYAKHLSSGGLNAIDLVWELRLSFQQFIDAKVGSWNYPWVLATLQVAICKGLLVFFSYGNWWIHNGYQCPLLIYNYPFCVHLFANFGQFLVFWVSEMVIPNGYHFLFNLLFPSSILILKLKVVLYWTNVFVFLGRPI
jgi:hypothetical protein